MKKNKILLVYGGLSALLSVCAGLDSFGSNPHLNETGSSVVEENKEIYTENLNSDASLADQPLIRYDIPYIDDGEMPILGYMGVPGNAFANANTVSFLTKSNIRAYSDCGFNILSALFEKEPTYTAESKKALRLCEEMEMAYFFQDADYRHSHDDANQANSCSNKTVNKMVQTLQKEYYINSPAYGGLVVRDEPGLHSFDCFANLQKAMEIVDSGKILYTNLYPGTANRGQLGVRPGSTSPSTWAEYENYVTSYFEKVKPSVVPYDAYYLYKEDQTISSLNDNKKNPGYLMKHLSLYSNLSKEHNIPYWVTVASWNHKQKEDYIPYKQNNWVVNASLAYGAKGIQYYTYWNLDVSSSSVNNWDKQDYSGLVTVNGTLHDNYYRIQKINKNIQAVDHVLMKAEHKGIMQTGTQHLILVEDDVLSSFGELKKIHGDTFVGCYELDGKSVYYVVNNSCDAGVQTFKLDFRGKVNVRLTNAEGVYEYENTSTVGVNLAGGDAVLVEVL